MKSVPLLLIAVSLTFAQDDLKKGIQLHDERKYEEAREIFESILKSDPNNAEANCRLGRLYTGHFRDSDKAIEYCSRAVEVNGKDSDYHYWLAMAYERKLNASGMFKAFGLARKMKSGLETAIQLDPGNLKARLALSGYFLQAPGIAGGSVDRAKALAEETLAIDEPTARRMLVGIYIKEENFALAEEQFKKAISLNPQLGSLYNDFGYFCLNMKRYDDAIAQFVKYTEVEPQNPNAYDSLGDGYFAKESYDEALSAYLKAVELNPAFSVSLFNLGKTYEEKGMRKEALDFYGRCVAASPQSRYAKEAEKKMRKLKKE